MLRTVRINQPIELVVLLVTNKKSLLALPGFHLSKTQETSESGKIFYFQILSEFTDDRDPSARFC